MGYKGLWEKKRMGEKTKAMFGLMEKGGLELLKTIIYPSNFTGSFDILIFYFIFFYYLLVFCLFFSNEAYIILFITKPK